MPKYYRQCCFQGHNETTYWTIHPKLLEEKHEAEQTDKAQVGSTANQRKVLTSGNIVGNNQNMIERMKRRKNKCNKDKYEHIEGEIDSKDDNLFDALREIDENKEYRFT